MPKCSNELTTDQLGRLIYEIRGERVMLDSDLASIYGVETKALNRAVKRNRDRFPKDFMFQLTEDEWKNLRYQIGTSSSGPEHQSLRYQIGTSSLGHGGRRRSPYVFTDHGPVHCSLGEGGSPITALLSALSFFNLLPLSAIFRAFMLRISETATRAKLIDPLLTEARWNLKDRTQADFEIPVDGYDKE